MKLIYFSKGLTSAEEKQFQQYMEKKLKSVSRLLSHFAEDAVQLQVNAERFEKNNAFQIEMILNVPQKQFVGKEASHALTKAMDLSKDRILKQLRKHSEVKRDHRGMKSDIKKALDPEYQAGSQYTLSGQADLY